MDYLFRIDTPAAQDYGVEATLEIELDRPSYLNGLHLEPFSNFPARLTRVRAEGLTTDTGHDLFSGNLVLDRAVSLRFDRQLIRRAFITLRQENYSFKEHVLSPADALRRETLLNAQAFLPFSTRRIHITDPQMVTGAQYEFGLKNIYGEDTFCNVPKDTGIFIAGLFEVFGMPELLRLDVEYSRGNGSVLKCLSCSVSCHF